LIHTLVKEFSRDGEVIVFPNSFDMNKGTLPLAEEEVLQSGQWDEGVLGVH